MALPRNGKSKASGLNRLKVKCEPMLTTMQNVGASREHKVGRRG
jgi:hypothetical protein